MRSDQQRDAILSVLRLRRADRVVAEPLRSELATVREFLEDLVGRTVTRAAAARMLDVSQTALDRWIDKGEIASVLTPRGRREVPLSELLELLEDVEDARDASSKRPLAAVIRERDRRARESIDLDRLLPRRRRGHRTAELQSLAYHRVIAERLDERLVEQARRRLHRWRDEGRIADSWAETWERNLALPLPRIKRAISADTPDARALRQTSPFAGLLNEQERRRLLRAVEERQPA